MRKRYNTPHRSRVVKTRMTEEEYAEFAERLSAYNMSQAEFIRQAITGAAIRPVRFLQKGSQGAGQSHTSCAGTGCAVG